MNKLVFLGVVEEAKESWDVLEELLGGLKLQPGTFSFNADLSLLNEILGLMPHSCAHPCPFCTWSKGEFGPGELRTFEGIREAHNEWVKAGSIKSDAKKFFNCVGVPISIFPEFGAVLLHITPPGLHIMMGVVDKLLKEMTRCYSKVEMWPEVLCMKKFKFVGNSNFEISDVKQETTTLFGHTKTLSFFLFCDLNLEKSVKSDLLKGALF